MNTVSRLVISYYVQRTYLWQRAYWCHCPGKDEHYLCPLGAGHVGDGAHYGRETVKGDDNHHEARGIESKDSKEDHHPADYIPCMPRYSGGPGYL